MHFCTIKERKLVCIPNVLRTNVMPFCSLAIQGVNASNIFIGDHTFSNKIDA